MVTDMIQDGTQDFYNQQAELARQYRLRPQTTMTATENIAAGAQPQSAESQNHQQTGAPAQGAQIENGATEKIAASAYMQSAGSTHIIRYALELGLLWVDGDGRDKVREALDALDTLEAQLEAIGAGGVSGPLIGQPQAMPDLSALTERGAKAWAGVDARGLREGRWYMVTHDGVATLCEDLRDAEKEAKDADMAWPHSGPHRAVQLVEASTAGFTAADMATASAQGFRDGVASVAASAGEPRDLNPRHIRKFLQALQAGEMSVSRAVEILDAWVDGCYKDEMVPPPPPDSCLIADDEFPMEIVRKLRSELAAAPPTAQAEGWRLVPVDPTPAMGKAAADAWLDCGSRLVLNKAAAAVAAGIAAAPNPPTSAEGVEP